MRPSTLSFSLSTSSCAASAFTYCAHTYTFSARVSSAESVPSSFLVVTGASLPPPQAVRASITITSAIASDMRLRFFIIIYILPLHFSVNVYYHKAAVDSTFTSKRFMNHIELNMAIVNAR